MIFIFSIFFRFFLNFHFIQKQNILCYFFNILINNFFFMKV